LNGVEGRMGELIKNIEKINIGGGALNVELNEPPSVHSDYDVHLQNEFFRFSLGKKDFLAFACTMLEAERQLRWLKGREQ